MKSKKAITIVVAVIVVAAAVVVGMKVSKDNKVQAMRDAGIADLTASVSLEDYQEKEQAEVQQILDDTEKAINESSNQATIDKLVSDAQTEIGKIKTDKQLQDEQAKKEADEKAAADQAAAEQAAADQALSEISAATDEASTADPDDCIGDEAEVFY